MDPEDKVAEYYEKWGPYQPGDTEDDHRLVAHICMDLEHESIWLLHSVSYVEQESELLEHLRAI